MGATTIEWTSTIDANGRVHPGFTFNPWWGCQEISPGCDHCYARTLAARYQAGRLLWGIASDRREFGDGHWNEPRKWDRYAKNIGVRLKVFCASMADVFDNAAPAGARERLWALIRETPNLDWLLLTKRIGNAKSMLPADWAGGYANVWLGSSIVNQEEADRDIPKLLAIPARVRFLSCEPLLGPIQFGPYSLTARPCFVCRMEDQTGAARGSMSHPINCGWRHDTDPAPHRSGIDWIISGGESGPKARPSHPAWHLSLRDQCAAAGVPFLFKQWGEWVPMMGHTHNVLTRGAKFTHPDGTIMGRAGKKAAGRTLSGRTHNGYPA